MARSPGFQFSGIATLYSAACGATASRWLPQALATDHPTAGRGPVQGDNLEFERLLLLERGRFPQWLALAAVPESGAVRDESFPAASLAALVAMVAEGLATTLLPRLVIDPGVVRGQTMTLTPREGAWPSEVIPAWRTASVRAAKFEAHTALLRAEQAQMAV